MDSIDARPTKLRCGKRAKVVVEPASTAARTCWFDAAFEHPTPGKTSKIAALKGPQVLKTT